MASLLEQEELKKAQKEQLKTAVSVLALELELQEGRRFNITKGAEEVAKVLKFSSQSDVQSVKDHLLQVIGLLTPAQIQFFKKKGVELNSDSATNKTQQPMYRGSSQASDAGSPASTESEEHKGKKKIVYRGQVKWV